MQHTELSKTALANHMNRLMKKGLIKKVARGEYNLTIDGKELLDAAVALYIDSVGREEEQREQMRRLYTEGLAEGKRLNRKIISKSLILAMLAILHRCHRRGPKSPGNRL